jgi:DNA-binding NtrC family response regulator
LRIASVLIFSKQRIHPKIEPIMPPATILVVDDDSTLCAAFAAVLQTKGYTTLCAGSAEEAMQVLAENTISLVFTDLNLPDVNGLGLLAQIKAAGITVPSILLTGAGEFTHADARNTGVTAFLVKPVPSEEILRVVAAALAQPEIIKESGLHALASGMHSRV